MYSAADDRTVRVWSGADGTLLMILRGHSDAVLALAIGLDGKVYSGSYDCSVMVWSGEAKDFSCVFLAVQPSAFPSMIHCSPSLPPLNTSKH